jgi:hypothetical protein
MTGRDTQWVAPDARERHMMCRTYTGFARRTVYTHLADAYAHAEDSHPVLAISRKPPWDV